VHVGRTVAIFNKRGEILPTHCFLIEVEGKRRLGTGERRRKEGEESMEKVKQLRSSYRNGLRRGEAGRFYALTSEERKKKKGVEVRKEGSSIQGRKMPARKRKDAEEKRRASKFGREERKLSERDRKGNSSAREGGAGGIVIRRLTSNIPSRRNREGGGLPTGKRSQKKVLMEIRGFTLYLASKKKGRGFAGAAVE